MALQWCGWGAGVVVRLGVGFIGLRVDVGRGGVCWFAVWLGGVLHCSGS